VLKDGDVGIGLVKTVLGGIYFGLGGCATLLEPLQGLEGTLGFIALESDLGEISLGTGILDLNIAGAGFGLFQLSLSACELSAGIGVIELNQQLTLVNLLPLVNEDVADGAGEGGMDFEVLDGLDLAISADGAIDVLARRRGFGHPNTQGP
jgi:hypothetical protein